MKRARVEMTSGSARARLAKFLLAYRLATRTITGVSHAEMLLGRRPRSRGSNKRAITMLTLVTGRCKPGKPFSFVTITRVISGCLGL